MFRGAPAGEFRPLTLEDVAALAIGLEKRIAELEDQDG